jgi:hypothetical protein
VVLEGTVCLEGFLEYEISILLNISTKFEHLGLG